MTSDPTDAPVPTGASRSRSSRPYWIPAIVALAVLLAIGVFVGAGDLQHRPPTSLAGSDVAAQISLGIQTQQHQTAPPAVRCPANEPVRAGWRFTCTVQIGGGERDVAVVEVDGRGRVEWSFSTP